MTDSSQLRASDADRDQAAQELRGHYAAGRITSEELSERLDAVYAARTEGELGALRTDLPVLAPAVVPDVGRELRRRRLYQDAGGVVIANVACVMVWLASGADGQFWPLWVMLVSVMRLARDGWRLLGPGSELEPAPGRRHGGDRGRRRSSDRR